MYWFYDNVWVYYIYLFFMPYYVLQMLSYTCFNYCQCLGGILVEYILVYSWLKVGHFLFFSYFMETKLTKTAEKKQNY